MKLAVELDDLGRLEAETSTFMSLKDRIAFERHFGMGTGVLAALGDALKSGDQEALRQVREEYMAFFAWRVFNRELQGFPDWDKFIEAVTSIQIGDAGEDDDDELEEAPSPLAAVQPGI